MESTAPALDNNHTALHQQLARTARRQFVEDWCASLPRVDSRVLDFLNELMQQPGTQREMQIRRNALLGYEAKRQDWLTQLARTWRDGLLPQFPAVLPLSATTQGLELLSKEAVENKLLASRLALVMLEHTGTVFTEVRRRTEYLQGHELAENDIVRGETLCLRLIEQWLEVGLSRDDLLLLLEALRSALMELALEHYRALLNLYDRHDIKTPTTLCVVRPARAAATGMHSADSSTTTLQRLQQMQPAAEKDGNNPVAVLGNTLEQARERAQGIMVQLHRLIEIEQQSAANQHHHSKAAQLTSASAAPSQPLAPASAALAQALAAQRVQALTGATNHALPAASPAGDSTQAVAQVANLVQQRTKQLKKNASSDSEKAIIEIVALMFQSILDEERIPSDMRVWLARLQVPVLRVALLEPDFFNNTAHPARKLIDRIGGCMLGFDGSKVDNAALEAEIRRVVQVIEQYPETGRRVFELVLDEFEKFLANFLTEKRETSQIVGVAQQLEQKEALAIQYTIGLRGMLENVPVQNEIREFLLKHWSEVLAISTVRSGAQHPDTLAFKRLATELVSSVSAKHQRAERAKIIENLPTLLGRLRSGLTLAGIVNEAQDTLIQTITHVLAAAFFSKTAAIPQTHIDTLAQQLVNLEHVMEEDIAGDLPLTAENLEMLTGIDASNIHVIADRAATPAQHLLAKALALPRGDWFILEYENKTIQVQYVWHSEHKQLHLFAAPSGSNWLIQLHSLAACLENGTLVAQEPEGLTQRAAREALNKLDAHPERILE